jgi:hypothetical protein
MKKLLGMVCVVASVVGCGSKDEPGTCLMGAGKSGETVMPSGCDVNTTKYSCDTSATLFKRKVDFFIEPGIEGARRCKRVGFIKATSGMKKGTVQVVRFQNDSDVERSLENGDKISYEALELP